MRTLFAATQSRIARAWALMRAHLRETNTIASIAARLHTGDPVVGLDVAAKAFAAGEHAAYVAGGQATARALDQVVRKNGAIRKKLLVFDAADPPAVEWAQRNRLDKIREITQQQREAIQGILVRGARAGTNPLVMAKEIREGIGLTAYQENIVANYRRDLEAGGERLRVALQRELTGGHADRTLTAAIRDGTAIPPDRIDSMVDAYRGNYIRMRSETIARTEGLRVAHQASNELYRQATANGDLAGQRVERRWVHGPKRGKHARDFHLSMTGQLRGLDEPFTSGRGVSLMHPGDPSAPADETLNCMCVVTTRVRRVA